MSYISLHTHTSMGSLLDGMGLTDDYCQYASEIGMTHLGISDHGTADNFINFQKSCKKFGIVPIFGVEFYVVPDITVKVKGEQRNHVLAFAKSEVGLQNILKMVSISNIEGFFFRPRISPEILLQHSEGLIITTGCSASPLNHEYGIKLFEDLIDKNPGDVYLEIMPHTHKEQYDVNKICFEFSEKYNVKMIATNDSHYVRKEDAKAHEVMLAVGTAKKWNDPTRWKFNGSDFYLRSRRDMIQAFVGQGQFEREVFAEAMSNTMEIGEKCSDLQWIKQSEVSLPKVSTINMNDDFQALEGLCKKAFIQKKFSSDKVYEDRLKEELDLIKEKKFERYFLLVWDLINWCRNEGIMVGPGRGSSSGSLVCYLLGITQIDPIKHGLLFFRFLAPDRTDLPDIDSDFSDIDRPKIRKRLEELYGKYNVASVSTFSILRGRGAMRDVSRVFEVPLKKVNDVCSVIEKKVGEDEGNDHTIEDALLNFEDGKKFYEEFPEVSDLAIKLEGQYRNRGTHAAALVVAENDLRDGTKCGLVLGKEKELVINWDKNTIEYFGLVKLDVLGLKMLTVLNYCRTLIKENHGIDIDFNSIPLDDKRYYEELSKGNTTGCFQLGSINMKKFCRQLGVDSFNTLVAATALYRPGPLGGGATETYIKRKNGEEEVPAQHPILDEITKDTYGVIVYQEQLMLIMYKLAGMEWSVVDKVRKLVAKSKGADALKKYEEEFVQGCLKNKTLREEQATELWNDLVSFGAYGFNLSHACSYSYITVWDIYFKLYYPVEFMTALLTYGTDNKDDQEEYVIESFRMGLDIRPPKVGISDAKQWKIHEGRLYTPFIEINGVGDKTAVGFEKLGKKKGFIDEKEPVSKRFLNILEKIGAYEDKALTDEEADEVSQHLGISLVRNKLYKYKKLIRLMDKDLGFSKVKDINLHDVDFQDKYYFGLITELNLSVKKGKENKFTAANASFKDETGSCKISFAKEFYDAFPSEIEHCEGEIILLQANTSKRAGSVRVEKAWFQKDLLSAEFGDLGLNVLETRRFQDYAVETCTECDLHKDGNIPKVSKSGRYNIMVIGETGIDIGYDFLRELKKHEIKEREINFSSFIKCPLKSAKEVTRKHVETCSVWLEREIQEIEPCLILGIGNTAVKFFTEEDTGINNLNGKTIWNERYGCYVAFCTSPSTLYYGGNNIIQFQDGVKNFCENAKNMGLGLF